MNESLTQDGVDFRRLLPAAVIAVVVAAYAGSFQGVWIFDDFLYIHPNRDLQHLWPPLYLLGTTRPVLYLTLAVNYAFGEWDIWGYHLVSLAIHLGCVVMLYALVRLVLDAEWFTKRVGATAPAWTAAAVAALWGVHPLTTMAVTYIWQRGESLMSLFYLGTLYCFVRANRSPHPTRWMGAALACFLFGIGSKEIIISTPIVVLLADRAFATGSFGKALRSRWPAYLGFVVLWGLQVAMIVGWRDRFHHNPGIGFESTTSTPWHYILTMPGVLLHYLRLSAWPDPLVFDYAWPIATSVAAVWQSLLVVLMLLLITGYGLARNARWAVVMAAFFLILAPTSSVMPMPDPAIEYRMYLPLATVLSLAVCGVVWHAGGVAQRLPVAFARRIVCLGGFCAVVGIGLLAWKTSIRNRVYRSREALWIDTVRKAPHNPRARANLGDRMVDRAIRNDAPELLGAALAEFDTAIQLDSDYNLAYYNRGVVLMHLGRLDEAVIALNQALAKKYFPDRVYYALGNIAWLRKDVREAVRFFALALKSNPQHRKAREAVTNIRRVVEQHGGDGNVPGHTVAPPPTD